MRSDFFRILSLLLTLVLAGCGADEEQARKLAQEKKIPPTETQLLTQARGGGDAEAKLLVEAGVNPNARQGNGMTVLMSAAFNGKLETAEALLAKGADVSATGAGYNALGMAVEKADLPMIKLLLKHGADPLQVPEKGKSAVERAKGRPETDALLAVLQLR